MTTTKKTKISAIILSAIIISGVFSACSAEKPAEIELTATVVSETAETENNAAEMTDEDKKALINTIAEKQRGRVTMNTESGVHAMTGALYFKLLFDDLGNTELYNKTIDAFNLTPEQCLADYETFWETIRENYPFRGVASRLGYDMDEIYADGKKVLKAYPNVVTLGTLIDYIPVKMRYMGHLRAITSADYEEYKSIYSNRSSWSKMYNEQCVIDNLKNWDIYYEYKDAWFSSMLEYPQESDELLEAEKKWSEENGHFSPEILGEVEQGEGLPSNENVTTNLLLDGKCAYLKLSSFTTWKDDEKTVDDFMEQISGCDDLIIDIRGNGGGDDTYWYNLISYLTDKELTYSKYGLTNITELNKPFIEERMGVANLQPLSELPSDLKVEQSDLDNTSYFISEVCQVVGSKKTVGFTGKIWLIVDSKVYSASENLAMFCRENNFATVVGCCTGGDGCCMDPINVSLPNSGLMYRFSTFNALNTDGSNNEEHGTTPDILLNDGDNAIDTILGQINQ